LKKVDAKEPLVLQVKRLDVERATRKNSKCCAFARACKRSQECKAAYFFRSTAWLEFNDTLVRYSLPASVQKEIVSFDRAGVTAPGTYQLSVPNRSDAPAVKRRGDKKRKSHHHAAGEGASGIKRKMLHRTALIRNTLEPTGT